MTTPFQNLLRDDRGANLVEFAIALPVLITFLWGMVQFALVLQANAGMQHALGEAARLATIHPTPDDATLKARMTARKFGTGVGTLGALVIEDVKDGGGATYAKKLTLTYSQPTNFLWFKGPTVSLNKTKTVYLSAPTT